MHKRILRAKVWLSVEIEVEGLDDVVDVGKEMGEAFELCWWEGPEDVELLLHMLETTADAFYNEASPFAAREVLNTIENYMTELEKSEEESL